jgi:ABC-type nitrate/sulfonate/bicarbonate transport system permease component
MTASRRTLVRLAEALWLPVLLVAAWWVFSANSTSFAFPSLQSIITALNDQWLFDKFLSDFVPSVFIVFQALGIAIVIGVGLGIPLGSSPTAEAAFRPLLDFMRGLPKVLLISPALVIIGVGDALALFVLTFGAIWPILLGAIDGVKGISATLHDLRRTYRLTQSTWLLKVALPAAMPQIFAGIRTAVALAVVLLVPAQAVGATSGLGFQLRQAADLFQFPLVWAAVIMFAALGFLLNMLLGLVERRALYWFNAQGGSA